ncbi:OmpH family outer membrane protein, partial [Sphingomonadaceae bacterium]|nr:OmpH family outer membrane protein [Sphingomonadaceae bacterium]
MTIFRKSFVKPLLAAGLVFGAAMPAFVAPVSAQTVAQGIGVVSIPGIIQNSSAFNTAEQQRRVTYKPQADQAEARRLQIAAQLQPLYDSLNAARQSATPDQAAMQATARQIQQIEAAGQREMQVMLAPLQLSQAYVQEQIEDQLSAAVQAAAAKKNITLILEQSGGTVVYATAPYNISQDVVNELNVLLPAAQLVPPEGWLPRELREQQAAAAAAQAAQPAPAQPS